MATKNLVDLKKELLIRVAGKEEKNHTLSWEILKRLGDNTQKLIDTLAKSSVETNLKPENLKLIFVGFFPGSAIPEWRLEDEPNLLFPITKELQVLNDDFNFVVRSINEGNFQKIADRYNEALVKNEVINAVYDFSNSAGTKPVAIVKKINAKEVKFRQLAKVRKMTIEQKQMLITKPVQTTETKTSSSEAVGKFLISKSAKGRLSTKKLQLYTQKEVDVSLHFDSIETDTKIYELKGDLTFYITDDKKSVSIENRLLDIYAQGKDLKEAEQDMFDQFDFTYRRLNEVEDSKLSLHLLDAKKYINLIVDKIKDK
jgi:hypothetical protein